MRKICATNDVDGRYAVGKGRRGAGSCLWRVLPPRWRNRCAPWRRRTAIVVWSLCLGPPWSARFVSRRSRRRGRLITNLPCHRLTVVTWRVQAVDATVRPLDPGFYSFETGVPTGIHGHHGALSWLSPDGEYVAFNSKEKSSEARVDGRTSTKLSVTCRLGVHRKAWNSDDVIIFGQNPGPSTPGNRDRRHANGGNRLNIDRLGNKPPYRPALLARRQTLPVTHDRRACLKLWHLHRLRSMPSRREQELRMPSPRRSARIRAIVRPRVGHSVRHT